MRWLIKRGNDKDLATAGRPIVRLRDEIDHVFDRFFGDVWGGWPMEDWLAAGTGLGAFPRVDLAESDEEVVVKAEVPGVEAKDIELSVADDVLTIRGEKKEQAENKQCDRHVVERRFGSFSRSIPLPGSADPDEVEATFSNGVLTVTVAKKPGAKPKTIKIKAE